MALNKAMIAKTKGKMPPPPSAKGDESEDSKDPMFDLPEDSADADAGAGEPDGDEAGAADADGGKGKDDAAHFQKLLAAVPTDRLKAELDRREDADNSDSKSSGEGAPDGDADDAGEAEEYNG